MEKNFEVLAFLGEKKNSVKVEISGDFSDHEFYFYLVKNGQVVSRDGWGESSVREYQNLEAGVYCIRGFVQRIGGGEKKSSFSNNVVVFDDALDSVYQAHLAGSDELLDLPYYKFDEPHQDILVVQASSTLDFAIPGFNAVKIDGGEKTVSVYANNPIAMRDGNLLVFSGSAFVGDALVFGQNEVSFVDPSALQDVTGDFVAACTIGDSVVLFNDYFGVQKLFYYKRGGVFLASNRVHLLLLAMVIVGVDCQMDVGNLSSVLVSGYTQPFQQIFTDELMVSGVRLLPVDKKLIFANDCVVFDNKKISNDLNGGLNIDSDGYRKLLSLGCDDIERQMRAVLNHKKFSNVVVDATGGMDSRVVLAATSRFKEHRHKIFVNAMDTTTIPLDIRVACTVADILALSYDGLDEEIRVSDKGQRVFSGISQLLGVYFAHDLSSRSRESAKRIDAINVTGFFGEICLRPYYSRSYLDIFRDGNFVFDDLAGFLLSENRSVLPDQTSMTIYKDSFSAALKKLPGDGIEKYDLHYLWYRNGMHCSDTFRYFYETPRVGVIQSPTLFRLKRALFGKGPKTLLQNDVIGHLCPELLSVPYASEKDNEDLAACKGYSSVVSWDKVGLSPISPSGDSAKKSRKEKKVFINNCLALDSNIVDFDLSAIAEKAVVELCEHGNLISRDLALLLISAIRGNVFSHVFVNKVVMAYYMWRITKMSRKDAESILIQGALRNR